MTKAIDRDPCIILSADDVRRLRKLDGRYIHLHPFQPDSACPDGDNNGELVTAWRLHQIKTSPSPDVGEVCWIREPFFVDTAPLFTDKPVVRYAADDNEHRYDWQPPMMMRKEHARIWLKVESAVLCRLFDLCEESPDLMGFPSTEILGKYWETRTAKTPAFRWWNNPWVVVTEYSTAQAPGTQKQPNEN